MESSAVAQPFWGRFFRALLLVLVAAMAHLWLAQQRRQPAGANAAAVVERAGDALVAKLDGRLPAELTDVRFGGLSSNSSAVGSTGMDAVQVVTQLVPVSTTGLAPATPAARPTPGATVKAELTPPRKPAAAPDTSEGEPAVLAAAKSEEPGEPATAEPVAVTAALQSNEPPADTPTPLMPLAAARRKLPDLDRRIAPPAAKSSSSVTERALAVAPIVEPDQKLLVTRVLQQYAAAYERLDVEAAKAVYPSIDGTRLSRAFEQLETQRVTFESCGITITGQDANARCQGENAYRPRIGPRSLHRKSREWTFNLAKADDGWQIVKATVR